MSEYTAEQLESMRMINHRYANFLYGRALDMAAHAQKSGESLPHVANKIANLDGGSHAFYALEVLDHPQRVYDAIEKRPTLDFDDIIKLSVLH